MALAWAYVTDELHIDVDRGWLRGGDQQGQGVGSELVHRRTVARQRRKSEGPAASTAGPSCLPHHRRPVSLAREPGTIPGGHRALHPGAEVIRLSALARQPDGATESPVIKSEGPGGCPSSPSPRLPPGWHPLSCGLSPPVLSRRPVAKATACISATSDFGYCGSRPAAPRHLAFGDPRSLAVSRTSRRAFARREARRLRAAARAV